jgi:hypothetical protein
LSFKSVLARTNGKLWIRCSGEDAWVPLEIEDRVALKKAGVEYVQYSYLFSQPGTIFYSPPDIQ